MISGASSLAASRPSTPGSSHQRTVIPIAPIKYCVRKGRDGLILCLVYRPVNLIQLSIYCDLPTSFSSPNFNISVMELAVAVRINNNNVSGTQHPEDPGVYLFNVVCFSVSGWPIHHLQLVARLFLESLLSANPTFSPVQLLQYPADGRRTVQPGNLSSPFFWRH